MESTTSPTIVITGAGAGAGIGAEAARQLAREGWTICATDINPTALANLREELGEDHHYARMDVTDADEVGSVMAEPTAVTGPSTRC
ncbi:SDR family NAD(P)-dependent oxidoreductase [Nocardioides sp. NPDC057767]|uniref:SDR family NAD(P)-dependent oxidoreductase n=1 Tax=unclassified Nocardioides TaxID=2615069 RepID=UPI00366ACC27